MYTCYLFPFVAFACVATCCSDLPSQHSVAREWNELALDAIRFDKPRPTVHARNLFHASTAIYDSWAAYDSTAHGYLYTEKAAAADIDSSRNETISYAAYGVLKHRFANSLGADRSLSAFDAKMDELGYDRDFTSTEGNTAAALGNRIAHRVIQHGLVDGANESNNYADTTGYVPVNAPLDVTLRGTTLVDKNRWQPLILHGETQEFLTPHWGKSFRLRLGRTRAERTPLGCWPRSATGRS